MHRRRLLVSGGTITLTVVRFPCGHAQASSLIPKEPFAAVLQEGLDDGLVGLAVQVTRRGDVVYEAAGLANRE